MKHYKTSQYAHGQPFKHGGQWIFYAPWRTSEPRGTSTEISSPTYHEARQKRARRVAAMTLELSGFSTEDANGATYDQQGSAIDMIRRAKK